MRRKVHQVKVKEDIAVNVIPMVDIMFLLVLFFMLAADMSQRDLEVVELPYAEKAINEKDLEKDPNAPNEKRPTINVYHAAAGLCPNYGPNKVCRQEEHWFYTLKGAHYNFNMLNVDDMTEGKKPRKMEEQLRDIRIEWDADWNKESGRPAEPASSLKPSEMPIMIRADQAAPFGYIQRAMGVCGKLFIYKTSVGASLELPEVPKK